MKVPEYRIDMMDKLIMDKSFTAKKRLLRAE